MGNVMLHNAANKYRHCVKKNYMPSKKIVMKHILNITISLGMFCDREITHLLLEFIVT